MNDHIVSCLDFDKLLKLTNCFMMTLCGFHSIPAHTAGSVVALLLCWKQNHPTPKMIPFSSCPMFGHISILYNSEPLLNQSNYHI